MRFYVFPALRLLVRQAEFGQGGFTGEFESALVVNQAKA